MGRKPKAGGSKGETTDPEQFARFLEAAREAGVDETGEAFERAFRRVASGKSASDGEATQTPRRRGKPKRTP
ncbi:MAG TPA: hypothetical protein VGN83_04475 [Falsiroseomonas sp.]|jgi:hypothetical protein|nr:hypothetical protein [Falsiroseomonas sp.]